VKSAAVELLAHLQAVPGTKLDAERAGLAAFGIDFDVSHLRDPATIVP
jgi:hypothetical protein